MKRYQDPYQFQNFLNREYREEKKGLIIGAILFILTLLVMVYLFFISPVLGGEPVIKRLVSFGAGILFLRFALHMKKDSTRIELLDSYCKTRKEDTEESRFSKRMWFSKGYLIVMPIACFLIGLLTYAILKILGIA